MRKRLDLFWRVALVLLVAAILAPAIATGDVTHASARTQLPETYMDLIPARINDVDIVAHPWISGTTMEGATGLGYDIVDVEVLVRRDIDGWYWNDGTPGWQATAPFWNSVAGVTQETWTTKQWFWDWSPAWLAGDFRAGYSYTIWARAIDQDGYADPTPASRTFIYDDEAPDVSFHTNFPARVYNLPEIKGTASDDCGVIAGVVEQVRILIADTTNSMYWNGFFWQTDAVWIPTQGTTSWSITHTTNPPLPKWIHDTNYWVMVQARDNANNLDVAAIPAPFLYRKEMTSAGCYMDPLPAYANDAAAATWTFWANGISGTAEALPIQNIVQVAVEIKDLTNNVYWDTTIPGWSGASPVWANCPTHTTLVQDALSGQWDWTLDLIPLGITWQQGHKYQFRAQATDDSATPKTYISNTESFIYDDLDPAQSNIDAFDDKVYNAWHQLTGNCMDDSKGAMGATVVSIINTAGDFWNGMHWGPDFWGDAGSLAGWWDYVFADARSGSYGTSTYVEWRLSPTTRYKLPPLIHNGVYAIVAFSFDVAGNYEPTSAIKVFEFRVDLSGYTPPAPTGTFVPGPTATAGPPVPTSTVVPTSPPAVPTATYVPPPPVKTATPAPPVATATPIPTPTPPVDDGDGWAWWYYLLIALGALLVIAIIVLILVRPKGEGTDMGEGEAYPEEVEEDL